MIRKAFPRWLLSLGMSALYANESPQLAILNNTSEPATVIIDNEEEIQLLPDHSHTRPIPPQGLRLKVRKGHTLQDTHGLEHRYVLEIEQEIHNTGHDKHLAIYPSIPALFDLQSVAPAA